MAERELPELRSRLRLDTAGAERQAMASARRMLANFNDPKALTGLTRGLEGFSDRASKVGGDLTRHVTLPLAAAGAASIAVAKDFNTTFTQMQTLAGVTGDEVAGLRSEVLGLATTTGQGPQELAKALYFVRSAGIDAANAMSVVEASAKGSAIGLGDTAAIADVVTSALNTYGSENLSATQAVDALSAAVAAGKGEAADFAPQLGALLPIAQGLGVGFDQVAGSVAFLTQTNGNVARSATMVSGVLQKLQAPSTSAAEVLESVGLSGEKLRKVVADQGVVAALQMLNEKLGGNREQLRAVFDDVEGFNGVLALLRNGGRDAAEVIAQVSGSAGYLANAFAKVQQTKEFKFQQALAQLQATAVEVGTQLIPILADVAGVVANVVGAFSDLPEPVQRGIIAVAGMAAALGPLAKSAGFAADGLVVLLKLARGDFGLSKLTAGLAGGAEASTGLASTIGPLLGTIAASPVAWAAAAAGVGVLTVALVKMADKAHDSVKAGKDLVDLAAETGKLPEQLFREQLANTLNGVEGGLGSAGRSSEVKGALEGIQRLGLGARELGKALLGTDQQWASYIANVREAADASLEQEKALGTDTEGMRRSQSVYDTTIERLNAWREQGKTVLTQEKAVAAEQRQHERVWRDLGVATDDATTATEGYVSASSQLSDQLEKDLQTARDLYDAHNAVADSADRVADAEATVASRHDATVAAEQRVTEQAHQAAQARADQAAAERAVAAARAEGARAVADAVRSETEAEADHADKLEQVRIEQEGLTAAREAAVRSLEDLDRSNRGDVLSVKEARLALKEAEKDARRAKPADREAAALRVERARLALESATQRAQDSTAELAQRRAAGVEGSPEVTAQLDRIAAAQVAEQESAQRVADAHQATADARVAASQRVADAEDRVREAGDRVASASGAVAQAHKDVATAQDAERQAAEDLDTAELNHVETQGELAKKLYGNEIGTRLLIAAYKDHAAALAPGSPARKNLEDYITDLERVLELLAIQEAANVSGIPALGPTAPPGAVNAEQRSGPGRKAPKLSLPDLSRTGPKAIGAAATGPTPIVVQQTFQIDGNPDESALRQLERVAERAVENGLRKVGTR